MSRTEHGIHFALTGEVRVIKGFPKVKAETVRHWLAIGAALFCLGFSILFTRYVFGEGAEFWNRFDRDTLLRVGELRRGWLNGAFVDISAMASISVLTVLLLLLIYVCWISRNRLGVIHSLLLFAGTLFLQDWAKGVFSRERPTVIPKLVEVASYSYPSGHAFAASAVYLTLAIMGSQIFRKPVHQIMLFVFASALITLIGFSRVYLGVHYPSDVVSGTAMGAAWAFVLAALVQRIPRQK